MSLNAKSKVAPRPCPVMMLPSVVTLSCVRTAPAICGSKSGWHVALLPSSSPRPPSILGAVQIAATYFSAAKALHCFITMSEAAMFSVPVLPPGSTIMSTDPKSTSSAGRSVLIHMPLDDSASGLPETDAMIVSTPALRSISTVMRASHSSNPSARKTTAFIYSSSGTCEIMSLSAIAG